MNAIREEFRRISLLFLSYGRVITAGMILSAIFFFLYTSVKANYKLAEILTTFITTLTLGIAILAFYISVRLTWNQRVAKHKHSPKRRKQKMRRRVVFEDHAVHHLAISIRELTERESETLWRARWENIQSIEHALLRLVIFIHVLASLVYYG